MSLSHSLITVHPWRWSDVVFSRSRRMFETIFAHQYAPFEPAASFGFTAGQFLPCQKSPSQKTISFADGKTMSGLPGIDSTFFLNRKPARHNSRRRITSCSVSRRQFRRFARLAVGEAGESPLKEGVLRAIEITGSSIWILRLLAMQIPVNSGLVERRR